MSGEGNPGGPGQNAGAPRPGPGDRDPGPSATLRSPRAWTVLVVAVLLSLGADLASKAAAFRWVAGRPVEVSRRQVLEQARVDPRHIGLLVPRHRPVVVVPGLLELTLVLNPGAVFGVGPGARWFFVGFTALALGFGVWMFARWTGPRDRLAHAALGMLIGGGLGNLYDRLVYACVRDFLHPLPRLEWPGQLRVFGGREVWPYVSNVADLLLLIGIGLLLVYLWRRDPAAVARAGPARASGG
ncbi:MAG TPA: signal peptidase II [Phycisphaerales bacterium]|nr:signal peptidase II [Phycisphaerales bacterium]